MCGKYEEIGSGCRHAYRNALRGQITSLAGTGSGCSRPSSRREPLVAIRNLRYWVRKKIEGCRLSCSSPTHAHDYSGHRPRPARKIPMASPPVSSAPGRAVSSPQHWRHRDHRALTLRPSAKTLLTELMYLHISLESVARS